MSGVAVPTPWPTAIADSGVGNYPVVIIDDGSYMLRDQEAGIANESSLVVRVEGLPDTTAAVSLAIDAAIAAYPSHPSDACLVLYTVGPIFGSRRTDGNSMVAGRGMTTDPGFVTDAGKNTGTTGTVVVVKMLFRRQPFIVAQASSPIIRVMRGDGTDYSVSAGGGSASGSVTMLVVGVASRADAIAAAEALYPTHPDDASMPYLGASARFVGLNGCGTDNQIWEVTLKFGSSNNNRKVGIYAQGYSGYEYTAADKHEYVVSKRFLNTDLSTVIAANTIGTFGPNGEPYSQHLANVVETTAGGDTVDITVRYRFPNDQYEAKSRVRVVPKWFPHIPKRDLRQTLTTIALDTPTAIDLASLALSKVSAVSIPMKAVEVFWQSATSVEAVFSGYEGKLNTVAYTIAGTTYPIGTLRFDGVEEIDFGATIATRFKTVIKFSAVPYAEAWFEITQYKPDAPVDPTKPYSFIITNPYSNAVSQAAFPTPPTYLP